MQMQTVQILGAVAVLTSFAVAELLQKRFFAPEWVFSLGILLSYR
jgi:hypothetical protein